MTQPLSRTNFDMQAAELSANELRNSAHIADDQTACTVSKIISVAIGILTAVVATLSAGPIVGILAGLVVGIGAYAISRCLSNCFARSQPNPQIIVQTPPWYHNVVQWIPSFSFRDTSYSGWGQHHPGGPIPPNQPAGRGNGHSPGGPIPPGGFSAPPPPGGHMGRGHNPVPPPGFPAPPPPGGHIGRGHNSPPNLPPPPPGGGHIGRGH